MRTHKHLISHSLGNYSKTNQPESVASFRSAMMWIAQDSAGGIDAGWYLDIIQSHNKCVTIE